MLLFSCFPISYSRKTTYVKAIHENDGISVRVSGPSHRVSVQGLQAQRRFILVQTGTSEGGHSQTGTPVRDEVKGNISYKGKEAAPEWDF